MAYQPEALQYLIDPQEMADHIRVFLATWARQVVVCRPGDRPPFPSASITTVPFLFCLAAGRMRAWVDDGRGPQACLLTAPCVLVFTSGSWVAAEENRPGVAYLRLTCADAYSLVGHIAYAEDHRPGTARPMAIATLDGAPCAQLADLAARLDANPADAAQDAAAAAVAELLLIDCARALADERRPRRDPCIERILARIHTDWAAPPGRDALAALVGLSPGQLSRRFTAAMGVGLARYCLDLRLQRARRELRRGDDTIAVVAERCGFSRASYFSRCYRERYGCQPQAERAGR